MVVRLGDPLFRRQYIGQRAAVDPRVFSPANLSTCGQTRQNYSWCGVVEYDHLRQAGRDDTPFRLFALFYTSSYAAYEHAHSIILSADFRFDVPNTAHLHDSEKYRGANDR